MTKTDFLILGCGHSESEENFNNNAAVINEKVLLIDCGHTIKQALKANSLSIADVDAVYISHVHGDHVFGLERVAYECKYKYKKSVKLFIHQELYVELWDQTLKGSMGRNGEGEAVLEDYFDVEIIENNEFKFSDVNYQIFPVQHTPKKPAYGILIDNNILYSTDTVAILDELNELEFNIGFHDVTLSDFNPVHATLNSLINVYPADIRRKLYLMSYEDEWRESESLVLKEFKGFAKQGMKLEL